MARWVPGGRYLVTWWKAPGYLPSGDPFLKFRPALGTATELPCTLCAMLSVLCFFGLCPFYLSFVSVCATRTSRNLLPFFVKILISNFSSSHLLSFYPPPSPHPSLLVILVVNVWEGPLLGVSLHLKMWDVFNQDLSLKRSVSFDQIGPV